MLLVLNSTGRKLNIRQMLRVKAPLKMKRNWKNKKKQNLEMTFKPYSAKTIILFLHLGFIPKPVALFTWVIAESQILPVGFSRKRSTRKRISASDESPVRDLFPSYAVDWSLRLSDS